MKNWERSIPILSVDITLFCTPLDELNKPLANQRMWQGWSDNRTDVVTRERGDANNSLGQSFALDHRERGEYSA